MTDGRIDCDVCSAGHYASDIGANVECTACELGKHTDGHDGQSFCTNCHAGMRGSRVQGVAACTECEAGRYQAIPGAKETCNQCECGKYTTSPGSAQCTSCNGASEAQSTCKSACTSEPHVRALPALDFTDSTSSFSSSFNTNTVGTCNDHLQNMTSLLAQALVTATARQNVTRSACSAAEGSVLIDINHDGRVDTLDAVSLFVAQTMMNFGAADVLADVYDRDSVWAGNSSPVAHIVAEVSTAVAQARGHT
jgi:hypothetical protein